jgi:hypothetical protein
MKRVTSEGLILGLEKTTIMPGIKLSLFYQVLALMD